MRGRGGGRRSFVRSFAGPFVPLLRRSAPPPSIESSFFSLLVLLPSRVLTKAGRDRRRMPLHCVFHSPSLLSSLLLETYQVRNLDRGHRTHRKEENTDGGPDADAHSSF